MGQKCNFQLKMPETATGRPLRILTGALHRCGGGTPAEPSALQAPAGLALFASGSIRLHKAQRSRTPLFPPSSGLWSPRKPEIRHGARVRAPQAPARPQPQPLAQRQAPQPPQQSARPLALRVAAPRGFRPQPQALALTIGELLGGLCGLSRPPQTALEPKEPSGEGAEELPQPEKRQAVAVLRVVAQPVAEEGRAVQQAQRPAKQPQVEVQV